MKNKKTSCIFEYYDFLYTCDFDKMFMWCIQPDEIDPITHLKIKRNDVAWWYRCGEDAPWIREEDEEISRILDWHYEQYLNQITVGSNRVTKADKAAQERLDRIPAADDSEDS